MSGSTSEQHHHKHTSEVDEKTDVYREVGLPSVTPRAARTVVSRRSTGGPDLFRRSEVQQSDIDALRAGLPEGPGRWRSPGGGESCPLCWNRATP